MEPKISSWPEFTQRVERICTEILHSVSGSGENEYLFSVDEKTGMQALERKTLSMVKAGKALRMEYEYIRHGTTSLMGAVHVGTGQMEFYRIHPTRKEEDFVTFIDSLCTQLGPEARIQILVDQLNIHKSESIVRYIADQIGFTGELGIKRRQGILKNLASRMAFLENENHRIRFLFTPKHCSWLNPIENWFGRLQKHRLNHASFSSVPDLEEKMTKYIQFANKHLSKPYKWKFKGFNKNKPLFIRT